MASFLEKGRIFIGDRLAFGLGLRALPVVVVVFHVNLFPVAGRFLLFSCQECIFRSKKSASERLCCVPLKAGAGT